MRICDVTVMAGNVAVETVARSDVVSGHYGYMLSGAVVDCQPFGVAAATLDPATVASHAATGALGTLDPLRFASDAALIAARDIVERSGPDRPLHALVYCHADIDEANEWVAATRLARELRLSDPLCFATSAVSHCAVFFALKLMAGQMALHPALATTLVVAADKWVYPFFRGFGAFGTVGDGAGALLLVRDGGPGADVLHVALAPADPAIDHFTGAAPPLDVDAQADRVVELIDHALRTSGTSRTALDRILPPAGPAMLVDAVAARLGHGLPPPRAEGHLSSADPLAALARDWAEVRRPGRISLWWTWGLNGEIGCALLRGATATGTDA